MLSRMVECGDLVWFHDADCGYVHPVEQYRYGRAYFDDYIERSRLRDSDRLMLVRENTVRNHHNGEIVDFGAGACTFVQHMKQTGYRGITGYDINPWSVQVLTNSQLYRDPWTGRKPEAMTFWDTLEHVADPEAIVSRVGKWAFLSAPIFLCMDHARRSKHYKPNEHIWYFTARGLRSLFERCGFVCVEEHNKESETCREGIGTFVFKRKSPC